MSKTQQKHTYSRNSEFVKVMKLTEEHYFFVERSRGKKSRAGFLKTVIDEYRLNHSEPNTEK